MLGETPSVTGLRAGTNRDAIPAAVTDIGCERELNEDRYAVIDSPVGKAWVVCDGMGGSLGGELAAQLAIDAIRRGLEARDFESPMEALLHAVEEANRIIVLRRQNPAFSGMGTTVVVSLIAGDEVIIAHAGDSRAYLVRSGAIQQLTIDHTYVQDLVDRGAIDEDEALSHPQAHVLTRCLGAEPRLKVDCQQFWIWGVADDEPHDWLLLCSDGLYSLVTDEEIAEMVTTRSPQESCVELVELSKARGGYDNITLAILPIRGQLREEQPTQQSSARKKSARQRTKQSGAVNGILSNISFGKRMLLVFFLFLIGCLGTALVMMLNLF